MEEDNWQWLMMPVKCLGKCCKNCPFVEIETNVEEIFSDDGSITSEVNLSCVNLGRCQQIQQAIKDGMENA